MTFEGLSLAGMATMTPKDFLLHLHKAGYRIVRNVARDITPTASGWDTPPSDLEKATDGDPTTATGEGVRTTTGSESTGYLYLDLGRPVTGIVLISADAKVDTAHATLNLEQKQGGVWGWGSDTLQYIDASEYHFKPIITTHIWNTEKIRIFFYVSTALTLTAKFYEIIVLEVIP